MTRHEEIAKIETFIAIRGITRCPAVGSRELVSIGEEKTKEWVMKMTYWMKRKTLIGTAMNSLDNHF